MYRMDDRPDPNEDGAGAVVAAMAVLALWAFLIGLLIGLLL